MSAHFTPLLVAIILCSGVSGCREHAIPPYLRVSGRAPALSDLPSSRALLVVFWASWCAPCREETPALLALARSPPDGLSVVVFSHDEAISQVHRFLKGPPEPGLHLRLDEGEAAAEAFGVEKLPTSFLLVGGNLRARFDGPREWASPGTQRLLRRLLDGETR